jgi:hypothetical protein
VVEQGTFPYLKTTLPFLGKSSRIGLPTQT